VNRLIVAVGALALAIGTAAAAAAAHVHDAADATRLGSAAQMLLVHGIGLLALALARRSWPSVARPLGWAALALAAGLALFAGSLLLAVAFDTTTTLAPLGGGLIILSWLMTAVIVLLSTGKSRG